MAVVSAILSMAKSPLQPFEHTLAALLNSKLKLSRFVNPVSD